MRPQTSLLLMELHMSGGRKAPDAPTAWTWEAVEARRRDEDTAAAPVLATTTLLKTMAPVWSDAAHASEEPPLKRQRVAAAAAPVGPATAGGEAVAPAHPTSAAGGGDGPRDAVEAGEGGCPAETRAGGAPTATPAAVVHLRSTDAAAPMVPMVDSGLVSISSEPASGGSKWLGEAPGSSLRLGSIGNGSCNSRRGSASGMAAGAAVAADVAAAAAGAAAAPPDADALARALQLLARSQAHASRVLLEYVPTATELLAARGRLDACRPDLQAGARRAAIVRLLEGALTSLRHELQLARGAHAVDAAELSRLRAALVESERRCAAQQRVMVTLSASLAHVICGAARGGLMDERGQLQLVQVRLFEGGHPRHPGWTCLAAVVACLLGLLTCAGGDSGGDAWGAPRPLAGSAASTLV